MPKEHRYSQDALNVMHQMISRGYDDEALIVFDAVDRPEAITFEGEAKPISRNSRPLLRTMIYSGRVGVISRLLSHGIEGHALYLLNIFWHFS